MTKEEFLEAVKLHDEWYTYHMTKEKRGKYLSCNVLFLHGHLFNKNLNTLKSAYLQFAQISNCSFYDYNFKNVTLSKCQITNSTFENCNFHSVDFTGSLFNNVTFKNCDLSSCRFYDYSDMEDRSAFLRTSHFLVNFINCDLRLAKF